MVQNEAKNWSVRGELMVVFLPPGPVEAEVWRDCCDTIAGGSVRRVLLASVGALELDSIQRRALNDALGRTAAQQSVAVVTDEAIVRGLMTATTWLGRIDIRTFAWHRLSEAVRHLDAAGISPGEVLALLDEVRRRAER